MNRIPSPVEKAAKKEKQEREGRVNMARYRDQQQRTLHRMALLRAQRLSQATIPADRDTRPLKNKDCEPRGPISGLYQGVRVRIPA